MHLCFSRFNNVYEQNEDQVRFNKVYKKNDQVNFLSFSNLDCCASPVPSNLPRVEGTTVIPTALSPVNTRD
jgi:hypothetical protein